MDELLVRVPVETGPDLEFGAIGGGAIFYVQALISEHAELRVLESPGLGWVAMPVVAVLERPS